LDKRTKETKGDASLLNRDLGFLDNDWALKPGFRSGQKLGFLTLLRELENVRTCLIADSLAFSR